MKTMTKWLPVLAAAVAIGGCVPTVTGASAGRDTGNPITAGPKADRCYPGGCGWFDIRSFEVVRETETGALIRLDMREGSSSHPNDQDAPRSARGVRIDWGEYENDTYLFCSTRLPAVLNRNEDSGGWEAYQLDLLTGGVPEESLATLYAHVCHPDGGLEGDGAAARLGYTDRGGRDGAFQLRRPEEIFERVGR